MEDRLSIRVNVADRYYPLKIERKDEEKIRRAARMINEKVLQYKQRYTDKDVQDFLAMAALQFVIKVIDNEKNDDISPVFNGVKEIVSELNEYINKE
jgi:cell division protein ZapA